MTTDSWKRLYPTLVGYALAALSLMFALFFLFWFIVAVGATLQGAPLFNAPAFETPTGYFLFGAPPLMGLFIYGGCYPFLVRLRYNDEGIERTFRGRQTFHAWAEFDRLERHAFFGPRLRFKGGGGMVVWDSLGGFRQFVEDAAVAGVKIDL